MTSPDVLATGALLFGAYEVLGHLGTGGMGTVYQARHRSLGEPRAIKVIRGESVADKEATEFFLREARALLRVQHDAIVRCHDLLRDETGRFYLVMELVEGPSLRARIRERPLDSDQVHALFVRLLSGLALAHERGVVHRDLSPDNIVLPAGRASDAKLIDFGLAKDVASDAMIASSGFRGRFLYAAPEQFGLFGGRIDLRSDLYSLGLVIAEAASGRSVFGSDDLGNLFETRQRPPRVPPEVSANLRGVLTSVLEPDPANRPPSAHAVVSALAEPKAFSSTVPRRTIELRRNAPALVGRRSELEEFGKVLEETRLGFGRMIALVGEPGIGKTILGQAFLQCAGDQGVLTA